MEWMILLLMSYGLVLYVKNDPSIIFKIANITFEEGMNPFEFLASTGYYTVLPRPEACTALHTDYNIQTSGVVISETIESHVFELNSLGNTVDSAVNNFSQLQNYCKTLKNQIQDIRNKQNWFDIIKDVVRIAGSMVNFMGGSRTIISVAENGIKSLLGMSFAADEELLEDVAIIVCDRASLDLTPGEIIDVLPLLE